ncbi:hypothetical protein [Gordonia paraffinivorans]|uniref:hypothetical protein n=1 Tax=Gordonia paraffinivorans TaxID=175628 RepID=UPI003FCC607C
MAALSALAASSVVAAPAVAATPTPVPPIDFGSLAGPNSPGTDKGRIGSPNGVSSIVVTVTDYNGRKLGPNLYNTSFSPRVQWSARDRSNA